MTVYHLRYLAIALIAACSNQPAQSHYVPHVRTITITTVPLLVKEEQGVLPFLKQDFGKGGVLDGKEVYAFSPSSITVVEGDTIHFNFINPEDDVHSFVLPDFVVPLPPQKTTAATYVAKRAGIYPFVCSIASHLPMMSGQLVVLAPSAVAATTVLTSAKSTTAVPAILSPTRPGPRDRSAASPS